uniref:Kazrin n=1 Tax=Sphenodon punctatus TaxID=8508 RepID=A0A8D0HN58_SPHPU
MMEDNKQLALRIDGAIQSASQEVTNLRAELTATNRRLAELSSSSSGGSSSTTTTTTTSSSSTTDPSIMENNQHNTQGKRLEEGEVVLGAGGAREGTPPLLWAS